MTKGLIPKGSLTPISFLLVIITSEYPPCIWKRASINLSKNFSSFEAVKKISFSINESEILGLLGPNGCGKTTTIGMMLGLLKPTSGEVIINGLNVEKNRINLLKKMK